MVEKFVFLDRDGTINFDYGHVHKIEDFKFLPTALEALRLLTLNKVHTYIVTNQAGIGKGLYTVEDFNILSNHMQKIFKRNEIKIDGVLFCPHHPQAKISQYKKTCKCRKPATGLIEKVMNDTNLSPENMAIIGDKNSDIEAGKKLSMRTYLVETGYGQRDKINTKADFIMPDLKTSVIHLLNDWGIEAS